MTFSENPKSGRLRLTSAPAGRHQGTTYSDSVFSQVGPFKNLFHATNDGRDTDISSMWLSVDFVAARPISIDY
ncbi:hypothetical protein CEXT_420731 [Caerostris extrusa]|uniref:Uncharacterized protein n=1 Tax=Caerostris extrusa TaxID=172846 RepID=A0AAV4P0U3_CAEEX|nr:hypothetical protein CEXT_420731 [Caerostris extrusa]